MPPPPELRRRHGPDRRSVSRILPQDVSVCYSYSACIDRIRLIVEHCACRTVLPSDLQYLTDEDVDEIGMNVVLPESRLCCAKSLYCIRQAVH